MELWGVLNTQTAPLLEHCQGCLGTGTCYTLQYSKLFKRNRHHQSGFRDFLSEGFLFEPQSSQTMIQRSIFKYTLGWYTTNYILDTEEWN